MNGSMMEVLESLPSDARQKVEEIFHIRRIKAGEPVFHQGDPADAIYLILDGRVKLERVDLDGHQCILCLRGPGEVFCPLPLLDGGAQLGTARAITDVTLIWAEREAFQAACEECPDLYKLLQQHFVKQMRRLVDRMETCTFHNIKERVAFILLEESCRQMTCGSTTQEVYLTQQDLAGLVGATRESVYRALSQLERDGLIETYRGRLVIRDRDRLQAMIYQN